MVAMLSRYTFIVLAGVMMFASCGTTPSIPPGSGRVVSESRNVSGFTGVDLEGIGELIIEQTGVESLTIQAEDNILPLLTSEVSNGILRLGTRNNANIVAHEPIIYRLSVKSLDSITASGAGDVTASRLQTATLTVSISGSGNVTASGMADAQDVVISGAGTYTAEDLASQKAKITIPGSGDAVVRVSDTLDVTISGAGSITYIGNPTVNQQISGAGTVMKRQ
jgi:Putative auto-transporter adhesin, head GIN domain